MRLPAFLLRGLQSLILAASLVTLGGCATGWYYWRENVQVEQVFFVTDRAPSARGYYGGERDTIRYGYATVEMRYLLPRARGELERANLSSSRRAAAIRHTIDSTKVFRLRAIREVSESEFVQMVQEQRRQHAERFEHDTTELLFIHGYNVNFRSAIERTAALQHRTNAHVAIAYSWPSRAKTFAYVADLEQARWTTPHLRASLERIETALGPRRLNVVVHSMGTLALANALDVEPDAGSPGTAQGRSMANQRFRSITFVNPDYDEQLFLRDALPVFRRAAPRLTLYGTQRDVPLRLSAVLRDGYPRAGQVRNGHMPCPAEIDCVDISRALPEGLLHHFDVLAPNSPLTTDFSLTVVQGSPAHCRAALGRYEKRGAVWIMLPKPRGFDPFDQNIPEDCHNYGPRYRISVQVPGPRAAVVRTVASAFAGEFGSASVSPDSSTISSGVIRVGDHLTRFDAKLSQSGSGFLAVLTGFASNSAEALATGPYYMISNRREWTADWQRLLAVVRHLQSWQP